MVSKGQFVGLDWNRITRVVPSGTRIFFPSPPQINIMLLLFHLQYTKNNSVTNTLGSIYSTNARGAEQISETNNSN